MIIIHFLCPAFHRHPMHFALCMRKNTVKQKDTSDPEGDQQMNQFSNSALQGDQGLTQVKFVYGVKGLGRKTEYDLALWLLVIGAVLFF